MTWEEKLEVCKGLSEVSLEMRCPGNWCVACVGVDIKEEGGILKSVRGNGTRPELAVLDHWRILTELQLGECIVVGAMRGNRRAVIWNGYMWKDIIEESRS